MDAARAAALNADLLARTGIDFSRYRNPELAEAVANAVTFPVYLGRSLTRPVGWLLLAAVLAFLLSDNAFFKTLLVFPGIVLVVANGILLGLVLFVHRIGDDLKEVFRLSTDLSVQALKDIGAARSRLAGQGGFPATLEIFQGLNAIVILPLVIETLDRRIPFFGGLAGKLTERVFGLADTRLAGRIAEAAPSRPATTKTDPADAARWLDTAERGVKSVQGAIGRAVNGVSRIVAFPFLAVLVVVALLSAGLLYAAWAVTS